MAQAGRGGKGAAGGRGAGECDGAVTEGDGEALMVQDGAMPNRLEITTNRGLEELVVQEFMRRAAAVGIAGATGTCRPHGLAGWASVEAEASVAELQALGLGLRSAHHVVRPVHRFVLDRGDPLGHVQRELAGLEIAELAPEGVSFRVTSQRSGTHAFTSEDVQRVAGAGVRDRAWRAVSLGAFDVEVRVDVRGDEVLVGVQLTRQALSRRHARPYLPHMSLAANVAWALLHLARPEAGRPPRALLDPFCGGGTILLEALALWPGIAVCGSDTSEKSVAGARANLAAAGLVGEVREGDARAVGAVWGERRFDTVVSNPPFGERLGPNMNFATLFGELLDGLCAVTTADARVALLVHKRGAFNHALRARPAWAVRHARVIELGGLHPAVIVLDRVG